MPITEAQQEARKAHIGSSDMPAILGLDPWRSPYDVWLEKTGKLQGDITNPAMIAGNRFESGVLEYAEQELGELMPNVNRVHPELPLAANIDAVVIGSKEPVECKTSGLFGPLNNEWGEPGTDEVPLNHIVQCHVHMMCLANGADANLCHLAAFLGGRGFCMFRIERNEDLCTLISEKSVEFWEQHVVPIKPPAGTPHIEVAKRIIRPQGSIVEIDARLVSEWRDAADARLDAEKIEKGAKENILASLGDAEIGDAGELGSVTYFESHRKGYTVSDTTCRTLRHRKPKKE